MGATGILRGGWWLQRGQESKRSDAYSEQNEASLESHLQTPLSNPESHCRAPVCHLALIMGH